MPEAKFRGYQYMEQREPFGDRRLDLIGGFITAGVRNGFLNQGQSGYSPKDFMPNWDTSEEMAEADRIAAMQEECNNLMLFKEGYERKRLVDAEMN